MINFKRVLVAAANISGKQLTVDVINLYSEMLAHKSEDDLIRAVKRHMLESNKFPSAKDILDAIPGNKETNSGEALAGRVLEAISRFGWTNPTKAQEWLGERAWRTAQLYGTWRSLCETVKQENKTFVFSQLRDFSESASDLATEETGHDRLSHDDAKKLLSALNFKIGTD